MCFADIVHFKNGKTYEGEVKETAEGYWVDGALFLKKEIDHIEEKKLPPRAKHHAHQSAVQKFSISSSGKIPSRLAGFMNEFSRNIKEREAQRSQDIESKLNELSLPQIILLLAGFFILTFLPLYIIARKLTISYAWLMWIPGLQVIMIPRMAGKTMGWIFKIFFGIPLALIGLFIISFLLKFTPGVAASLVGSVLFSLWFCFAFFCFWLTIAKNLGKPKILVVLAFILSTVSGTLDIVTAYKGISPPGGMIFLWDIFEILTYFPWLAVLWYLALSKKSSDKKETKQTNKKTPPEGPRTSPQKTPQERPQQNTPHPPPYRA
ncbi:MAG: hypothetical protein KAJ18_09690 [Candidatus Omnitrophica bacterium]|nr:hypothetical protein [Candidatus Omnitrophota bacterium]